LLIVIGIIAVLIAVTLLIGRSVVGGAKRSATLDTLRILDAALAQTIAANDGNPPPMVNVTGVPGVLVDNTFYAAADARNMDTSAPAAPGPAGFPMINSVALFMHQANAVPAAKASLEKIPGKYARLAFAGFDPARADAPSLITAFDGWGNPIRYVHPSFDGVLTDSETATNPNPDTKRTLTEVVGPATERLTAPKYLPIDLRRNHADKSAAVPPAAPREEFADSDGGSCPSSRPYFYSAGPDGRVGRSRPAAGSPVVDYDADNVYTTQPKAPPPS